MRTGRTIIVSIILALGASGSILATSAIATTPASHAHSVHVEAASARVFYHS
jgi:hypothetical protein